MINFIMGFVGLGLFGASGTFRPDHQRAEVFQGRVGHVVAWVVMIIGLYLVYRGWVRPWL